MSIIRLTARALILLLLGALLLSGRLGTAAAQEEAVPVEAGLAEKKKRDSNGARWSFVPVVLYGPETSLVLGAAALRTFHLGEPAAAGTENEPRRSSLQMLAAYSLNNQFLAGLGPSLYLDGEAWHLTGNFAGVWFPTTIYPLGNDTPDDSSEDSETRAFEAKIGATRAVFRDLRVGGLVLVQHLEFTEAEAGGLIDTGAVPGSAGGFAVGAGARLVWDDRDSDFSSQGGSYYSLTAIVHRTEVGSDYDFVLVTADARRFFAPIAAHVLGVQLYGRFSAGDVPYALMSELGGGERMRGLFQGRFVDRHLVTAQVEYRLPVYWRFGAEAFAAVGRVAESLDGFGLGGFHATGGVGARFALSPKDRAYLRLDVAAASTGDTNFYFQLGDAF